MATTPVPAAEPQAGISPFGRIIGMFFSPTATFEDIVRKPSWILPTALIIVLGVAGVVALNSHFNWRDYMVQQIEKNPRAASLSADQKAQQVEGGAKFAPIIAYASGLVAPVVILLVVSLVLMLAYNLMAGAGAGFNTSFSIAAHAFVPAAILGTILFITVLFLKPIGSFDLDNPVATNLAIILPEESAKWLVALCKNIDILEFWKIFLLGIGFAAVNPKKLKGGKAFTIAFSVFVIYVVLRVGIAFVTS
jgi:hypothetical protein